jgi:ribulose-5-phosphate 4-epimerase/fuculose-1-phosphate aldolase
MTTLLNQTAVDDEMAGIPEPPTFASPTEELKYRKQRAAAGYRMLARFGLDEGIAGHITIRDTHRLDHLWTAPFGAYFGRVRASDLILVGPDGTVAEGEGLLNRAAFAIHSRIHEARPDVVAAVHAHGLHGKTFSMADRLLAPLTQDACAFYGDHGRFDDYTGVVFDPSEGDRIAAALGAGKAVILANHGHLTVGTTTSAALWWFVTMERSMQAELLAAGDVNPLPDDVAKATADTVGREDVGTFAFEPIFQRLIHEQPDLLD